MLEWSTIARSELAGGGELTLVRRGDEWVVRVDGRTLMSSRLHDSEEALAEQALARVVDPGAVLVGGLGFGYTLRAVLDRVSAEAQVTVAELVPALVEWNRTHVADLAARPLDDVRCNVQIGDVLDVIEGSRGAFDVILLDVDNGPIAMAQASNQRLYEDAGIAACRAALRHSGVLAVWSAGSSAAFERRLRANGFHVEVLRVPARSGSGGRHFIFVARVDLESGSITARRRQTRRARGSR